jgi:hybrid cluster-associated redox disulfide protein
MAKEKKITKKMTIGDIVENYPDAIQVLLENGIHCIGCAAAHWENLEQGLTMHGKSEEEINAMVEEMNKIISKKK